MVMTPNRRLLSTGLQNTHTRLSCVHRAQQSLHYVATIYTLYTDAKATSATFTHHGRTASIQNPFARERAAVGHALPDSSDPVGAVISILYLQPFTGSLCGNGFVES